MLKQLIRNGEAVLVRGVPILVAACTAGPPARKLATALAVYSTIARSGRKFGYLCEDAVAIFSRVVQDVSFLQIGSNDGVRNDPIHEYVKGQGWQGVFVEPIESLYLKLKAHYAGCKNLSFEQAAVSDRDGPARFYRVRTEGEELPAWLDQVGSFWRGNIVALKSLVPDIEERIVEEQVECISGASLRRKYRLTSVDLLHIDAEGADFRIMKSLDLATFDVKVILYEHRLLSEADRRACLDYLHDLGYRTIGGGQADTVAFKLRVPVLEDSAIALPCS